MDFYATTSVPSEFIRFEVDFDCVGMLVEPSSGFFLFVLAVEESSDKDCKHKSYIEDNSGL